MAKQLLAAGAEVNTKGLDDDTPLHDASNNGHFKVGNSLLPFSLQLWMFFLFCHKCLVKINVYYFCQVVKLLLRYGGDPRQSNRRGETPLMVANSPTMLNLLLGKGTYTSSEESSSGMHEQILRDDVIGTWLVSLNFVNIAFFFFLL